MTIPRFSSLAGTGAGMAVPSAAGDFRPYVYGGTKHWVPEEPRAGTGGTAAAREQAAERREEFARLRAVVGMSVAEAGKAVGIRPNTAAKYERRRLREGAGGT